VFRVVNDGVRDLSSTDIGFPGHSVDITPDGDVWLSGDGLTFRLGEEAESRFPVAIWPPYPEVAPDGSLWATSETAIYSFDGEEWAVQATTSDGALRFGSLAIGHDGTVWVMDWTGMVLLRLEEDGTLAPIEAGADVYSGLVSPDEIAVSPDGDVWLVGMVRGTAPDAEALLRFDGSEWEVIPGPESFLNHPVGNSLDIGPDGTLWVNTSNGYSGPQGVGGLARLDDAGWTTFTEAVGVQAWGGQGFIATDLLAVAPDGSLWMNGAADDEGCGGVAHYEGVMWASYLVEFCIHDLAIAPDGSAWLRANTYGTDGNPLGGVDTYVITPEAAAASE
jgi:sugar lactone lactonase YvrE